MIANNEGAAVMPLQPSEISDSGTGTRRRSINIISFAPPRRMIIGLCFIIQEEVNVLQPSPSYESGRVILPISIETTMVGWLNDSNSSA